MAVLDNSDDIHWGSNRKFRTSREAGRRQCRSWGGAIDEHNREYATLTNALYIGLLQQVGIVTAGKAGCMWFRPRGMLLAY